MHLNITKKFLNFPDGVNDAWMAALRGPPRRAWMVIWLGGTEINMERCIMKSKSILHCAGRISVVPARLGLKAISKAQLFMALAFQNWSLSHAHRLSLGSGCGLWGKKNLSGDFHAQKKKDQVTSLKDNDMIIFIYAYLTHFHTFIWI